LCLAALTSLFDAAPAAAQSLKFTNELGSTCVSAPNPAVGVAVDPQSGHVVVTAAATGQACILGADGSLIAMLTQADGLTIFQFDLPTGVAIDPDTGQIVVADAGDGEDPNSGGVRVFDANGVLSTTQLTLLGGDSGFDTPTGVAIDGSQTATRGQIVVVDFSFVTDVPAIRVFNAINPGDAAATRNSGTPGSEQILDTAVDGPYSTAIDSFGNIWVGDLVDSEIDEYNAGLTNPARLTFDGESDVFAIPLPASLSFDPITGDLASSFDMGFPGFIIFSHPGAPFVSDAAFAPIRHAARRPIAAASMFTAHPAPAVSAQHSLHSAAWMRNRVVAMAQRRAVKPDCGCAISTLVAATPLLLTDGASYETFAAINGGLTGGQEFDVPESIPAFIPLAYTGPNTLLAGPDSNGLLQRYVFVGMIPTLGTAAALGFAALLGLFGLMRLRRAA
jgi:hypothetical protein